MNQVFDARVMIVVYLLGFLFFVGMMFFANWLQKKFGPKLTEDDLDFMDKMHGITPELKTYFVKLAMQRQNLARRRSIGRP